MDESPQMALVPTEASIITPDEVLVGRLRSGESAAGDELVRRYGQPLLGYLHRLSGNASLAEELHQQTWLSVLDHLDRFDDSSGKGSFRAWLFRIATNKVNDLWRSRGRQKKATDGLRLVTDQEAPDASQAPEAAETQLKLQRAMEQLPESQRQVVAMRYYSNMKFAEIAQALGCPLNTALGRMHKALMKLRKLLEQQDKAGMP